MMRNIPAQLTLRTSSKVCLNGKATFLSLPVELRVEIYNYLLQPGATASIGRVTSGPNRETEKITHITPSFDAGICFVSRQLYLESIDILYDKNFTFSASLRVPKAFFRQISSARNASIRKIQLNHNVFNATQMQEDFGDFTRLIEFWRFLARSTSLHTVEISLCCSTDADHVLREIGSHQDNLWNNLWMMLGLRATDYLEVILQSSSSCGEIKSSSLGRLSLQLPNYYPRVMEEKASLSDEKLSAKGTVINGPLTSNEALDLATAHTHESFPAWKARLGLEAQQLEDVVSKTDPRIAIDVHLSTEGMTLHTRLL